MFDPDVYPLRDFGLRCRDCGYPLANLTRHQCPECGLTFTLDEYIPEGAMPLLIADGEHVRATAGTVERLRRYHIPFVEQVSRVRSAFAGIDRALSRHTGEPIMVPRDHYFEAIDLLRRQKLGEPMPDPPPSEASGPDWTCPHCHEANPAHFELCWNCENQREAD